MNIVVSDPKTSKAYSKKTDEPVFLNKKIGDEVQLSIIGLEGYTGKITGGSDKNGFPMKPTMQGSIRKKIFISEGVGFNPKRKGIRVRKTVRGNTIAGDIHQVNIAVTKEGPTPLEKIFAKPEEGKEESKEGEKKEESNKEKK